VSASIWASWRKPALLSCARTTNQRGSAAKIGLCEPVMNSSSPHSMLVSPASGASGRCGSGDDDRMWRMPAGNTIRSPRSSSTGVSSASPLIQQHPCVTRWNWPWCVAGSLSYQVPQ